MPKIFQRCCPQRRKMIGVVAYNVQKYSNLRCFSALLPTTPIIFLHCAPQRGKIISVVAYTAEKLLALFPTMWKNVWIWISPQIRNHMQIYTRVSIRGLGWCVSWTKVEVKISWNCPFKRRLEEGRRKEGCIYTELQWTAVRNTVRSEKVGNLHT